MLKKASQTALETTSKFNETLKEVSGCYSYARVFGALFCLSGLIFLTVSPRVSQYKEIGYFLISLGYGGKILQKPFEKK